MYTCGDIFSNTPDGDCCIFYSITIAILNYSLYSSVDLFREKEYNGKICQVLVGLVFFLNRVIIHAFNIII